MYKQQCCRKLMFVCDCYLQTKVIFVFLFLVPTEGLSLIINCHTSVRIPPTSLFSTPSSANAPLIEAFFQQQQITQFDPNDNDNTSNYDASAVQPQ